MEQFHLTATEKTPEVLFDMQRGLLELKGCSIHENAEAFFRPLLDRMEQYIKRPSPVTKAKITLSYFNSSSSKYLLDLLRLLDEVHRAGTGEVLLEWHHDPEDLDMEEAGRDYSALLRMPVRLVAAPIP